MAPFSGFIIDTNKGVRPCCTYEDKYLGNLSHQTLKEIIEGQEWHNLKLDLAAQKVPKGCQNCFDRETLTGWSVRKLFLDDSFGFDIKGWDKGHITYIEFAGNNRCNLACLHCTPGFSSKWQADWEKLMQIDKEHPDHSPESDDRWRVYKVRPVEPELILKNLQTLDLSHLRTISFKGGEPFLNAENEIILDFLQSRNLLGQIDVSIVTNGTVYNPKMIKLLSRAASLKVCISLDGIGQLNEYIRYGPSDTDLIKKNIKKFNELANVTIDRITSILPYNLTQLIEIRNWWTDLSKQCDKVLPVAEFKLVVTSPPWLNPCVLSDGFRDKVVNHLKKNQINREFEPMLPALAESFQGAALHNRWVKYTRSMEQIRGNSIVKLVPELESELHLIGE
ncbi:MAG: twitch domain-containing radical SAM protein [Pseudobdellovibrionaceae bacterium]